MISFLSLVVSPGVSRNCVTSQYWGSDFPRLFCMRLRHNLLPNGFGTAKSKQYPIFWYYAICRGGASNDLNYWRDRREDRLGLEGYDRVAWRWFKPLVEFISDPKSVPWQTHGISARIRVSAGPIEADHWSCLGPLWKMSTPSSPSCHNITLRPNSTPLFLSPLGNTVRSGKFW